jgi:hypothetical protein
MAATRTPVATVMRLENGEGASMENLLRAARALGVLARLNQPETSQVRGLDDLYSQVHSRITIRHTFRFGDLEPTPLSRPDHES